MSRNHFAAEYRVAVDDLRESVVNVLWRQWAAVGAMAAAPAQDQSIVDAEALILMSLSMSYGDSGEARLRDLVAGWGIINSRLLSVQRLGNLAKDYPDPTRRKLIPAAVKLWATAGKDHRWKSLGDESAPMAYRTNKAMSVEAPIDRPAVLMLRLRRALGVGLRPDVMSFLLSMHGRPQSVRAIVSATRYTHAPLRRAINDMTEAGILDLAIAEGADHFTINAKRWSSALGFRSAPPTWINWTDLFCAAIALIDLKADADGSVGPTAFGALGRDVWQRNSSGLLLAECTRGQDATDGTALVTRAANCLSAYFKGRK
ncbi:MAG TPA: hypothetical protein VII66_10200 [Gemmatimonadaceae bacterium]